VYSFSQLVTTVGVGLGPMVLGFVDDASGYGWAYLLAAVSSGVALVLFLAAGPPTRPFMTPEPVAVAREVPVARPATTTVRST
jgi:MFS family permease